MVNCLLIFFLDSVFSLNGIFSKSYFVLIIRIIFAAVLTLRLLVVFLLLRKKNSNESVSEQCRKVYKL